MMLMENDEFTIPEQYLKMSAYQLDEETKKALEQIENTPRVIKRKKKASDGKKDIIFNV